MAYNRNTAKAKAVHRSLEGKTRHHGIKVPDLTSWAPEVLPYIPRCRHCGSSSTPRAGRCMGCGARV